MRLGLALGYAPPGTNPTELVDLAVEAALRERLARGLDDAQTVAAGIGAHRAFERRQVDR